MMAASDAFVEEEIRTNGGGEGKTAGEEAVGDLGEWDAGDDPGPIPPRPWLLGNQFCCGFISSLFAAGGVGKSALRLVQFISLALGRSLCGQHIFRRSRVLLISLEDDREELERRIAAVLIHFGVQRRELKGWLFCSTPTGSKLAELQNNKRVPGKLGQQIRDAIARRKPDLVALDPFIKLHDLGENDSGDMNFVCGLLTRLAVESKIAVDVPHHIHKGQVVAGDADSGRGSSGIRDAGRLIFTLTIMSADGSAELQHRTRSALQLRPPRQRQGEHCSPLRRSELVQDCRRADRQRHGRISRRRHDPSCRTLVAARRLGRTVDRHAQRHPRLYRRRNTRRGRPADRRTLQ